MCNKIKAKSSWVHLILEGCHELILYIPENYSAISPVVYKILANKHTEKPSCNFVNRMKCINVLGCRIETEEGGWETTKKTGKN